MDSDETQLVGLDEKTNKPPASRLKNGASARAILDRMIKDDEQSGWRRAVVDGWVGGNPPYSDAKRKAANLGWTANLNFMGGKALMDSSAVPYYSIFAGVEYYAETRTAYQPNHPDHEEWHGKIQKRFHNLLKRWKQFDWNIQAVSYHMRKHGVGACFFERVGDWRFRAIPSGMMLAPRNAPSCLDKRVPKVGIRCRYSVAELYGYIREKSDGWNVDAVKLAIKRAGKSLLGNNSQNWYSSPWETYEQILRNDDLSASYTQFDEVSVGHLLVHEFSGKITHAIVTEQAVIPEDGRTEKSADAEFLYKHVDKYNDYDEVLVPFFQNMGEGTWHSVRGLADDAFKHGEVMNRLMCRMVDGAFIGSSLVLKSLNTGSRDKAQLTQWGAVTLLPAGTDIVPTALAGALDGPVVVHRLISNNLSSNIGMAHPRSLSREDGRGEMPTKAQVDAQVMADSTLSMGNMTLFFYPLDTVYFQMFKRASDPGTTDKEALRFQRECKEDGVPAKALEDMEFVRANRLSGYGSPQMRQQSFRHMLESGAVGAMSPEGQAHFWRDSTSGEMGAEKTDRYFPKEHLPNQDDAWAQMENAMMSEGRSPVLTSTQDDAVHLQSHMADAGHTLEPLGQAMEAGQSDPAALQQAYKYVQIVGQHCEAHIQRLKGNVTRKAMAKMFNDQLQNLVSFSGKLRGAIISAQREAQAAAQEQQQAVALGALDQARADSIRNHDALAAEKTAAGIRNSTIKTMNTVRLKQISTASDLANEKARTEHQTEQAAA